MKKIKYLLILFLIAILSTSVVVAKEITFDIPEDYEVTSTNSTCANLVNKEDSRIKISIVDEIQISSTEIINNLIKQFNSKVEKTKTYSINGKQVIETVLDIPDGTNSKYCLYTFESNGHKYCLSLATIDYNSWDIGSKENPVNKIISTLILSDSNNLDSSSLSLNDVAIPPGFSIDSRNESQMTIYNDGSPTYIITVTSENLKNPEKISEGFVDNGYIHLSTNDIKVNSKNMIEETYIYNNNYGYVYNYIAQFGDKKYSISCLTDNENWNVNDNNNPVNIIINSMINS